MKPEAYEIDPSWPVVRDESLDILEEGDEETCENCNCRAAVTLGERGGVETWLCGVCR